MRQPTVIDEPARSDSKLEWWFVHGRFAAKQAEERYFMASLFRLRIRDPEGQPVTGFSALISVLDPGNGEQRTSSRVDRQIVAALRRQDAGPEVDPCASAAVLDEIREYGLPREFECPEAEPVLEARPLRFEWADLQLSACGGAILLAFQEPGSGRPLSFELTATAPRLVIEDAATLGEPEETMQFMTYPEVRLRGTAGGQEVEGEAWFDHQWGGTGWMRSRGRPARLRGWDWMGFRLEDGSAGVALTHWDAASRQVFASYLTLRDSDGATRSTRSFHWEPERWWISPATRIEHPVAWSLRVPEWELELQFEPLAEHQEIRVFGSLRAIWEGAGRVRGRWGGRNVEGPARLEGQGRGYVFDGAGFLKSWAGLVDRELARFLPRTIAECDVRRYAGPPAWTYDPDA